MSAAVFTTPESRLRATRKYREKNPDKIKTFCKFYYDTHADELKQKKREKYSQMTPEQRKTKQQTEYSKVKAKRIAAKIEKNRLLEST